MCVYVYVCQWPRWQHIVDRNLVGILSYARNQCFLIFIMIFVYPFFILCIFFFILVYNKRKQSTRIVLEVFFFRFILLFLFWWKRKLNKNPTFFIFCRQKLSSCFCVVASMVKLLAVTFFWG